MANGWTTQFDKKSNAAANPANGVAAALKQKMDAAIRSKREADLRNKTVSARNEALADGRKRGEEIFSEGSLGRISEGYSPEEMGAMRDQNMGTVQQGTQSTLRALRGNLAANGVRGGAATAANLQVRNDGNQNLAKMEQDLFLKNMEQKRQAQQYNIEQKNKETMGRQSTELGYGSLGAGENAAINSTLLGMDQRDAALALANKETGKK